MDRSNIIHEGRLNPGWRNGSGGTPRRWLTDNGIFYLSPNAGSTTATVLHMQVPTAMADDGATPDSRITEAHHDALALMAAAQLLLQGRDQASAAKAGAMMNGYLLAIGKMPQGAGA